MTIANGQDILAEDHLNKYHVHGNVCIGKNGTIYIPVYINNVSGARNVKLALWGKAAGSSASALNHGVSEHKHQIAASGNNGSTGSGYETSSPNEYFSWDYDDVDNTDKASTISVYNVGTNMIAYTNVPSDVQIWIDGSEYTATIGDPNGKGATMYDTVNADWGVGGSTAWDTDWLNLTSVISWTAGWHYIEIKETGGYGGTLIYVLAINTGHV